MSAGRPLRLLSLLLVAVTVLVAWGARAWPEVLPSPQGRSVVVVAAPAARPDTQICRVLASLSAQAAHLTGALALVEAPERPAQAAQAAAQARLLATWAAQVETMAGSVPTLSGVLSDLAVALEGYAAGDPAALAGVRQASARNAALRATYDGCAVEP